MLHSPLRLTLFAHRRARYLLPAARVAKLKARVRVYRLVRAAFYTVHYNARACTHYTVRVIHYQPILQAPLGKIRKL